MTRSFATTTVDAHGQRARLLAVALAGGGVVMTFVLFVQQPPVTKAHKPPAALQNPPTAGSPVRKSSTSAIEASKANRLAGAALLPFGFEPNEGQAAPQVKFLSHAGPYTLFLMPHQVAFRFHHSRSGAAAPFRIRSGAAQAEALPVRKQPSLPRLAAQRRPERRPPDLVRMNFVGANPEVGLDGIDELPGKTNYFLGSNPDDWRTSIPNYAQVVYRQIYPGVDVVFHGSQRQLEFDFLVSPGTDPQIISLGILPSHHLHLDQDGNLEVRTNGEVLVLHKPSVYQRIGSGTHPIDGGFVLRKRNRVGFRIGAYDPTLALVIDPMVSPIISYSTYLGGSRDDAGTAVAVDTSGNAYLSGYTDSTDFPTVGGEQKALKGSYDAFVAKLNSTGTALVYSTYLGGSMNDLAEAIAIDSSGDAYVTGYTASPDFPGVNPLGKCGLGASDAFVAKISADGSKLLFSTCLGGSQADQGLGIALDSSQNMYVVGDTSSSDFPVTSGAYQTIYGGNADAFFTEIKADGSSLLYSTFLGGSSDDHARGVALDPLGHVLITGNTTSPDFPVTASAYQKAFGGSGALNLGDAFVSEIQPAGGGSADLLYSTYLGGASDDAATSVAADATGYAYVTGLTASTRFPTVKPFQPGLAGGDDAFVAKLNPAASGAASLVFSTYLGGSGGDEGTGIVVDSADNIYVSGVTTSKDFPVAGAFQLANASVNGLNAFYAKLVSAGNAIIHSSYLGGSSNDTGRAIAIDSSGNAYLVGNATSPDFPVTAGALETTYGGAGTDNYGDAFITKILPSPTLTPAPASLSFNTVNAGSTTGPQTITLTNTGDAPLSVSGIIAGSPFSQSNTCQTPVAVLARCTVNVIFSPGGIGTASGTLSVADNAGGSPQVIPLSGTAVGFAISASNTTAQVTAGAPASYSLTITPNGFSGPVSLGCSVAPTGPACTLSPSSVTLDGSTAESISVSVSTTSRSTLPPPFHLAPLPPQVEIVIALMGCLLIVCFLVFSVGRWPRPALLKLALVLFLSAIAAGCTISGGSSSKAGTPPGTYQISVSGTSGGFSAGVNLSLVVQ